MLLASSMLSPRTERRPAGLLERPACRLLARFLLCRSGAWVRCEQRQANQGHLRLYGYGGADLALNRADAASAASAVMEVTLDEPSEVTLSREVVRVSSWVVVCILDSFSARCGPRCGGAAVRRYGGTAVGRW